MKKDTWLIVANSTIARLFKIDKKTSLIEIEDFVHPESRLHNRDLVSERSGRTFDSFGPSRHAMEPTHSPKQNEFNVFAREISHYLDKAQKEGRFERLYVAAGPMQLGLIRQHLSPSTTKLITGEIDKDMTHIPTNEILSHLPFII